MEIFTNPALQSLRRALRKIGLTRLIAKLLAGKTYEEKFDAAMRAAVIDARIVWDIGENVGIYTKIFSNLVAVGGKIVAFEPSPRNARLLLEATEADERITIRQCALSDKVGYMYFQATTEGLGTTDHIVVHDTGLQVEVTTADALIFECGVAAPDFLKIDVEGFEMNVLNGMKRLLREKPPRHIFCEVHFAQLDKMGMKNAAQDIIKLLAGNNYTIKWTDQSHIHAYIMRYGDLQASRQ